VTLTARQAGVLVAVLHVALVGSLGIKLRVDRARYPRAWARSAPVDPDLPLRGRYVRLNLRVPVTPDSGAGGMSGALYGVRLAADHDTLVGRLDAELESPKVRITEVRGAWTATLNHPVPFFIPEHIPDPSIRAAGEELWVEVTLPHRGPPRPIRLGVKKDGTLTPLDIR
jgi:hypothetical protein